MNESPDTLSAGTNSSPQAASSGDSWGWYLYGIVRADQQTGDSAGDSVATEGEAPIEVITQGDVQAVVRRVPLVEFAPEAIQAHASDPAWLEEFARRHNDVISALHARRTIVPAKLGAVYVSEDDIRAALEAEHDRLLAHLRAIDGCDEWGIRLYGDVAMIRQQAEASREGVRRVQEELASAAPGRAYFLRRKLDEERAAASDSALDDLVDQAYRHLMEHAAAGQISARIPGSRLAQRSGEAEVMRAAFLVRREYADTFLASVQALAEKQPGLRCEYSGPWPAYSFAAEIEEATP